MARCLVCYDLEKKDPDDPRLASEFVPNQLLAVSNNRNHCAACSFILEGIRHFEDETWKFAKDVSRVYLYALASEDDSLTVEIYFHADRPKLVLEYFRTNGE
jgi:hypothetical protein